MVWDVGLFSFPSLGVCVWRNETRERGDSEEGIAAKKADALFSREDGSVSSLHVERLSIIPYLLMHCGIGITLGANQP